MASTGTLLIVTLATKNCTARLESWKLSKGLNFKFLFRNLRTTTIDAASLWCKNSFISCQFLALKVPVNIRDTATNSTTRKPFLFLECFVN